MTMCFQWEIQTWTYKKKYTDQLIKYIFSQKLSIFVDNLASEGHLLVGKFTSTGGEFERASGDFPHQFISLKMPWFKYQLIGLAVVPDNAWR